jgi:DNA-binding IclR family transcriptional regulator
MSRTESPAPDRSAPDTAAKAAQRTREVPAVRRATAMLWLLARHPEGLSLSRIARELEIIPSTCLHILRELASSRLVAYDANAKLYRLGNGVLSLARELTKQNPFVQAAQPLLTRLSREFEVGASAQERDGDDDMLVVAAASVLPGDMVSAGGRTPLFTSASGRLLAAHNNFSEAELRHRFARARWQDAPSFATWLEEVRALRGRRHAIDEGQFRKGITAIAGPVFDADGKVERTISVTVVSAQLDAPLRSRLTQAVEHAANEISQALR